MSKKLYALTDSEASELRRLVDAAQLRAWAVDDADGYKDNHYLMVRLNTPLDMDDAVERMARAILRNTYGGNVDLLSYNAWEIARSDARAALDALLQGVTHGAE